MPRAVIAAAARTAIGKLAGQFATLSAMDLGGAAIAEALRRAGADPASVDAVLMGQVLQAGQGQITARQAAVKAGVPMTVHATTINKVCLSGLQALYLADLMVRAGEADLVVAGGMESMTSAPYLLPGARAGYRLGDQPVVDSMMHDGLYCAFDHCAMGLSTERHLAGRISRERQDEFSARSHQLAAKAQASGALGEEIVEVIVSQRKGDPVSVATDEGVRADTTAEALAGLRPAFDKEGTVTAGNASQISDGGAAIVVMSEARADAARRRAPRRARRLRPGRRARRVAAHPALQRDPPGCGPRRPLAHRPRPLRDQRGLRRGRARLDRRPRPRRGPGQRPRRRHRARPPDRHVRRAHSR